MNTFAIIGAIGAGLWEVTKAFTLLAYDASSWAYNTYKDWQEKKNGK